VEGIQYLLGLADTDANKGRADGHSPLMLAALKNLGDATDALLGFPSVDLNYRGGPDGNTALIVSVNKNSKAVFDKLIANRFVDVNVPNGDRKTALYLAASYEQVENTEALLNRGADPNMFGRMEANGREKTIYDLAVNNKFPSPVINRMIRNMVKYGATFNAPPVPAGTPKVALASLDRLRINVYPKGDDAVDLFGRMGVRMTIPVQIHGRPSAEAQVDFLRRVFLVRDICAGLGPNYIALKFTAISFYVELTGGEDDRLIGFLFGTLQPRKRAVFLEAICTRNTVGGAGKILMDFLKAMTESGEYTNVLLESVDSAVDFYVSQGFRKLKPTSKQDAAGLWPMVWTRPAGAGAAGDVAGGAGAGAGASARRGGTRRGGRRTRRTQRKKTHLIH
jgi:hypothetical protein